MKETGQLLKKAREEQGLTKDEVALVIKVNTKTVSAMESGDLESLPPKTFLRGFVRAYANLLKLDTQFILDTFMAEMGSTKPQIAILDQENEENRQKAIKDSMSEEKTPISKQLLWVAVGLVTFLLIIFVFNQIKKYEKEAIKPEVALPNQELQSPKETKDSEDVVSSEPEQEVEEKKQKKEAKKIEEKTEKKEVVEKKPLQKKLPEKKKLVEEPSPKKAEKPEKKKEQPVVNNEVILEAFDKIKITYSFADGKTQTFEMKEDDIRVLKGKGKIKINISDGGSLNIVHNGKDLGVPGTLGSPVKLNL